MSDFSTDNLKQDFSAQTDGTYVNPIEAVYNQDSNFNQGNGAKKFDFSNISNKLQNVADIYNQWKDSGLLERINMVGDIFKGDYSTKQDGTVTNVNTSMKLKSPDDYEKIDPVDDIKDADPDGDIDTPLPQRIGGHISESLLDMVEARSEQGPFQYSKRDIFK